MPHPVLPRCPLALALAVSFTLAACGGAGSDSGGGGGGSSSTATVASLEKLTLPTDNSGATIDNRSLRATNDGVYFRYTGNSTALTRIFKRTVGRGTPARWQEVSVPTRGATFAPTYTTREGVDEFGIYWTGTSSGSRYGSSNMNNSGTSINYAQDRYVQVLVPPGDTSSVAQGWGLGSSQVYYQATGGGISTDFSARYNAVATLPTSSLGGYPAVADGTGNLYVASANVLYKVTASGAYSSWDLSTSLGFGTIHTLLYQDNRLWVGYGTYIMQMAAGTSALQPFKTVGGFAGTALAPQFCIVGTTLYASDGNSYQGINLPSSTTTRPWIEGPGTVPISSLQSLSEIKGAMASGLYCAGASGTDAVLYTVGLDLSDNGAFKLFVMRPR